MLVTGGPPNFGGGGIRQRIMVSSRSVPALRTNPAWAAGFRGNGSRLGWW